MSFHNKDVTPWHHCILSLERIGYIKTFTILTFHQDHLLYTQENHIYNLKSFWDEDKGQIGFSFNLYSKKYIRILQMLETQLKSNRKGNSSFYYSPLYFSSMILPCSHDMHHFSVFHISWTWPCDPALPPYFFCSSFPNPWTSFLLLQIQSRTI